MPLVLEEYLARCGAGGVVPHPVIAERLSHLQDVSPGGLLVSVAGLHVGSRDLEALLFALLQHERVGGGGSAAQLHLDLSDAWVDSNATACINTLVAYLRSLRGVAALVLRGSHLSDADGEVIVSALTASYSVSTLDLANNNVGGATIVAVAELLRSPRARLTRLCLDSNRFSDGPGVALAEAVGANASLRALSLRRCNLGLRTGAALLRALERTSSLLHAHVEYNLLQRAVLEGLEARLSANRKAFVFAVERAALAAKAGAAAPRLAPSNDVLPEHVAADAAARHLAVGEEGPVIAPSPKRAATASGSVFGAAPAAPPEAGLPGAGAAPLPLASRQLKGGFGSSGTPGAFLVGSCDVGSVGGGAADASASTLVVAPPDRLPPDLASALPSMAWAVSRSPAAVLSGNTIDLVNAWDYPPPLPAVHGASLQSPVQVQAAFQAHVQRLPLAAAEALPAAAAAAAAQSADQRPSVPAASAAATGAVTMTLFLQQAVSSADAAAPVPGEGGRSSRPRHPSCNSSGGDRGTGGGGSNGLVAALASALPATSHEAAFEPMRDIPDGPPEKLNGYASAPAVVTLPPALAAAPRHLHLQLQQRGERRIKPRESPRQQQQQQQQDLQQQQQQHLQQQPPTVAAGAPSEQQQRQLRAPASAFSLVTVPVASGPAPPAPSVSPAAASDVSQLSSSYQHVPMATPRMPLLAGGMTGEGTINFSGSQDVPRPAFTHGVFTAAAWPLPAPPRSPPQQQQWPLSLAAHRAPLSPAAAAAAAEARTSSPPRYALPTPLLPASAAAAAAAAVGTTIVAGSTAPTLLLVPPSLSGSSTPPTLRLHQAAGPVSKSCSPGDAAAALQASEHSLLGQGNSAGAPAVSAASARHLEPPARAPAAPSALVPPRLTQPPPPRPVGGAAAGVLLKSHTIGAPPPSSTSAPSASASARALTPSATPLSAPSPVDGTGGSCPSPPEPAAAGDALFLPTRPSPSAAAAAAPPQPRSPDALPPHDPSKRDLARGAAAEEEVRVAASSSSAAATKGAAEHGGERGAITGSADVSFSYAPAIGSRSHMLHRENPSHYLHRDHQPPQETSGVGKIFFSAFGGGSTPAPPPPQATRISPKKPARSIPALVDASAAAAAAAAAAAGATASAAGSTGGGSRSGSTVGTGSVRRVHSSGSLFPAPAAAAAAAPGGPSGDDDSRSVASSSAASASFPRRSTLLAAARGRQRQLQQLSQQQLQAPLSPTVALAEDGSSSTGAGGGGYLRETVNSRAKTRSRSAAAAAAAARGSQANLSSGPAPVVAAAAASVVPTAVLGLPVPAGNVSFRLSRRVGGASAVVGGGGGGGGGGGLAASPTQLQLPPAAMHAHRDYVARRSAVDGGVAIAATTQWMAGLRSSASASSASASSGEHFHHPPPPPPHSTSAAAAAAASSSPPSRKSPLVSRVAAAVAAEAATACDAVSSAAAGAVFAPAPFSANPSAAALAFPRTTAAPLPTPHAISRRALPSPQRAGGAAAAAAAPQRGLPSTRSMPAPAPLLPAVAAASVLALAVPGSGALGWQRPAAAAPTGRNAAAGDDSLVGIPWPRLPPPRGPTDSGAAASSGSDFNSGLADHRAIDTAAAISAQQLAALLHSQSPTLSRWPTDAAASVAAAEAAATQATFAARVAGAAITPPDLPCAPEEEDEKEDKGCTSVVVVGGPADTGTSSAIAALPLSHTNGDEETTAGAAALEGASAEHPGVEEGTPPPHPRPAAPAAEGPPLETDVGGNNSASTEPTPSQQLPPACGLAPTPIVATAEETSATTAALHSASLDPPPEVKQDLVEEVATSSVAAAEESAAAPEEHAVQLQQPSAGVALAVPISQPPRIRATKSPGLQPLQQAQQQGLPLPHASLSITTLAGDPPPPLLPPRLHVDYNAAQAALLRQRGQGPLRTQQPLRSPARSRPATGTSSTIRASPNRQQIQAGGSIAATQGAARAQLPPRPREPQ